jgi:steroid 5-alpha reductase family enzyme
MAAAVTAAAAVDGGALGVNLAVTAVLIACVMAVTFALAQRLGRHSVIDTVWGLGFALVALCTFALSEKLMPTGAGGSVRIGNPAGPGDLTGRILITTLTVVWGVRLAVHIGLRSRGQGEDPRYEKLLADAPGNPAAHALRLVYLPQAVVLWFVSLPVQVGQYLPPTSTAWAVTRYTVGAVIWLTGFCFETVGDYQLARFRARPVPPGESRGVLDYGLWRYTRHPNYFGDACVWWGLYLLACGGWPGAITILSPLLMTYLLAGKTGKPLMESHMADSRPGYAEYVRRTSSFLPRRPAPAREPSDQPVKAG